MGRPAKEESRCKRHPKHRQSVGVCPFCLRERLSHLTHSSSSSSSAAYLSSSSASSSAYSTSDSDLSSYASTPPHHCDVKRPEGWLLPKPRVAARGEETSDSDLSSYASTPPHHCDVKRPEGWLLPKPRVAARGGKLTKSLSLVFLVRSHEEDEKEPKILADHKGKEKEKMMKKKKKSRFWSKLLSGSNGRQKTRMAGGALLHSHTFKEKPSPKLVLFA
ncbi:hypothetical protein OPV22_023696 [Ensete ventricosum]|uniref:Uncharacterized protein n=1 Tax=Ensete ventricosum TaxID=4639 RepID=A0AAV8QSU0_ENSVE|nr:hypothetical protein OPV22_023696 [Ensete ventricosum]RZS09432.1 hypothetical protein BHM03_00040505 [Ensete ventricosum]